MYSQDQDRRFEEAVVFATKALKACHTSKPVLLHSLRVAFLLYAKNYEIEVCIAALLHDLLEDTATEKSEIEKCFGEEISSLVSSLTMDDTIKDYKEQYIENFMRCQYNKSALIIRCADILDNSKFVLLTSTDKQKEIREKHLYFYKIAYEILKEEVIWQAFEEYITQMREKR